MAFINKCICSILLGLCCLNSYSQPIGKIVTNKAESNGFEKVLQGKDSNLVLFGFYTDSNDVSLEYPAGLHYPNLTTYPNYKNISLRVPYANYQRYGHNYGQRPDRFIQLNDSMYAYTFYTVDTGQRYKSSRNWMVIFDNKGDTLKFQEIKTANNFEIVASYYLKKSNEFLFVGVDTLYYVGGISQSIYKIDSNGNIVWHKSIQDECGPYFWGIFSTVDQSDDVLLVGNISIRPSSSFPCYTKYYFRRHNSLTGDFISTLVVTDSINDFADARMDDIKELSNNNLIGIGLPEADYWLPTDPMLGWEVPRDEQVVLLFDKLGHLRNKTKIFDAIPNKRFANAFDKVIPLRKEGAFLLGKYADTLPENRDMTISRLGTSLMRVDNDIKIKWIRNYQYLNYKQSYLQDITEGLGGGYWLSGYILNDTFSIRHGWIVHTDTFGCVVPGCQLYDAIQRIDPDREKRVIAVFPNPTRGLLAVQFSPQFEGALNECIIVGLTGKIEKQVLVKEDGNEFTIDIRELPEGTYYLLLKNNDLLIGGEKFIKY